MFAILVGDFEVADDNPCSELQFRERYVTEINFRDSDLLCLNSWSKMVWAWPPYGSREFHLLPEVDLLRFRK